MPHLTLDTHRHGAPGIGRSITGVPDWFDLEGSSMDSEPQVALLSHLESDARSSRRTRTLISVVNNSETKVAHRGMRDAHTTEPLPPRPLSVPRPHHSTRLCNLSSSCFPSFAAMNCDPRGISLVASTTG